MVNELPMIAVVSATGSAKAADYCLNKWRSGTDHTVLAANNTIPLSVHQTAPPLIVVSGI